MRYYRDCNTMVQIFQYPTISFILIILLLNMHQATASNLVSNCFASQSSSRVIFEDTSNQKRRLSFHSPPKLPLYFNQNIIQRTHTPILKGAFSKPGLQPSKKFCWTAMGPGSADQVKKFDIVNKQNIDMGRVGAPKVSRFEALENKEVLEFSKNRSKRRIKTAHSSNSIIQEKYNFGYNPIPSCFQQQKTIKKICLKEVCLQDFQMKRKIGKGKFGNVFFAIHKELNFLCALKTISKQKIKREKCQEQIIQEIKIQSKVSHPNIVSLYGFFADTDNIYLVLEYCSSGDLYTLMKRKKKIPQIQSVNLIKQILEGLVYLHRNNIVHRDIKPQNIMLEQGAIKIGDFGWVASFQNGLRKTFCGTPLYLSPQLLLGEEYDQRIDIWALGILAYEMMFGSNPFQIKTHSQLQRILNTEIEFPSGIDISISAKDFIERVLQKKSKYRIDGEQLLMHPFVKNQCLKTD